MEAAHSGHTPANSASRLRVVRPSEGAQTVAQRKALFRMRAIAGGLLAIMTVAFFVASYLISRLGYPHGHWLSYVKAFGEAAMVGGIADWFAVTALFRHPLGLPIPHTAIIPTKKDRIAQSLGSFVENNFLTPEVLDSKLKSLELSKRVEEWLSVPDNSRLVAENIAAFIPPILDALDDDNVRSFIETKILQRISGEDVANVGGNILTVLTTNRKHDALFNELMRIAITLLDENKDFIRQKLKEETPWFVPQFVNNRMYHKIIANADKTFWDATKDPNHPIRKKFNSLIESFIHNLQNSPDFHEKIEEIKKELLENPVVQQYLQQVWGDLKSYILQNITHPDSTIKAQIQKGVFTFFNNLMNDEKLRTKIPNWIHETILSLATKYRSEIGNLIVTTMQKWDRQEISQKLELQVGKDLQYIRINGTLVGGLIGLILHFISSTLHFLG